MEEIEMKLVYIEKDNSNTIYYVLRYGTGLYRRVENPVEWQVSDLGIWQIVYVEEDLEILENAFQLLDHKSIQEIINKNNHLTSYFYTMVV